MSDYWTRRAAEDALAGERAAQDVITEIGALHRAAQRQLMAAAKRMRERMMRAYGLDAARADELLAAPCGREEYLHLLEEIGRLKRDNPLREELMAKAAAPGYAYRIRLEEAMADEVEAITAHMAQQEEQRLRAHLTQRAQEAASHAAYRAAAQSGIGFAYRGIGEGVIRRMLDAPWSGASFSSRIWRSREKLADVLNGVLREGVATGRRTDAVAQEIAEAMDVSFARARTLVRTENNYVSGQADMAGYAQSGVTKYRFAAVLDMRTSRVCQALDGKIFPVSEAKVGKNLHPMHPNCRSTTTAVIDGEARGNMTRFARDPVTGKGVKVAADMTYGEWLAMQEETYGKERVALARRMAKSRGADGRQYAKYQSVLGKKRLPESLEKFQLMKYTEGEEWDRTKRAVQTVGELSQKKGTEAFRKKAVDTYWAFRAEDVEMADHAVVRFIDRGKKLGIDVRQFADFVKGKPNYRQADGRLVYFKRGMAAIQNESTGEIITIVERSTPKKDWMVIE